MVKECFLNTNQLLAKISSIDSYRDCNVMSLFSSLVESRILIPPADQKLIWTKAALPSAKDYIKIQIKT